MANWCVLQFHQCLGHRKSGIFSFADGIFHSADMSFNEAIGLRVV